MDHLIVRSGTYCVVALYGCVLKWAGPLVERNGDPQFARQLAGRGLSGRARAARVCIAYNLRDMMEKPNSPAARQNMSRRPRDKRIIRQYSSTNVITVG